MKKIVKKLSLAMALVTCTTMSVTAIPQLDIYAEGASSCTTQLEYLQIEKFKKTGTVNEEYTFAPFNLKGTALANSASVELTVKDPRGVVVATFDSTTIASAKFTPLMSGGYTAIYKVTEGTKVSESEFKISVRASTETVNITFKENDAKIVPTKVAPKQADGSATVIEMPAAVLTDAEGNVIEGAALDDLEVKVTASANNGAVVAFDAATMKLTLDKENIVANHDTKKDKATYKVRYEAYKVVSADKKVLLATSTIEIEVVADFEAPTYKYSYTSTKPTTAEIGVETVLPGVEAKSIKDNSKVSVYYTVTVTHKGQDVSSAVLKTNDKGAYVFTPNAEGDYVFTYDIKDFNGKAPSVDSTSFTIKDVADRTQPEPLVTLPYSVADDKVNDVDAVEALADVQVNVDVMLLPISAVDAANDAIENNLTVYRQIVNATNSKVVFDESKYDVAEGATYANKHAGQALIFNHPTADSLASRDVYLAGEKYTIADIQMHAVAEYDGQALTLEPGKYTVKYIAKDKLSGKGEKVASYSLEVLGTALGTVTAKPTVTFAKATPIPSSANPGDVVKFNVPTATQTKEGNFADTRLSTYVTYELSVDKEAWIESADLTEALKGLIELNEAKTEYTLNIPALEDLGEYQYIKVVANSRNDAGNVGTSEKVIKFIGTGDAEATTIANPVSDIDTSACDNAKVGMNAALPKVTYTDDLPRYVNMGVTIEDENGVAYTAQNMNATFDGNTVTFADGYFLPETKGLYTVTYTTSDANNNKTVLVFAINVVANEDFFHANFENQPSNINEGKAELGETISLPAFDAYVSDSEYLQASEWYMSVEGPANYETDWETKITFNEVGKYTIQFKSDITYKQAIGTHVAGDPFILEDGTSTITTKKYTIEVTDTKGPEVLNQVQLEKEFFDLSKDGSQALLNKKLKLDGTGDDLKLPMPEVSDDVVMADSNLAVICGGITYDTFKLDENGMNSLKNTGITLSKNGVYSFVYTLKDANGNSTVLDEFTLDVGDVEAPVVKVESGVVDATYKTTQTVVVDMSKITATDNLDGDMIVEEDGKYKINVGKIKVTLEDSEGNSVSSTSTPSNSNLAYQFESLSAGEYTLVVAVTDSSGKTETNREVKFTVVDAEGTATTSEEVLGIVLIVVSVLMLGGVVTYFVVTRKKYKY